MFQEIQGKIFDSTSVMEDEVFLERQKVPSRKNIRSFIFDSMVKYSPQPPFVDVACGYRTNGVEVQKVFKDLEKEYIAFDLLNLSGHVEDPNATQNLQADAKSIPLGENSVNAVICTEVLEHVFDDNTVLMEIRRVLQRDGLLFLTIPGIDVPKHEKLYQKDYRRYTNDALSSLLKKNNFEVIEMMEKFFKKKHINTLIVAK
jgi:ubiquinone/menaquinone biosynthesis C-methylase UbiE